jgi:hypothetical protein
MPPLIQNSSTHPLKISGPGGNHALARIRFRRVMWISMILLCVIGAAAVIRRMAALAHPSQQAATELAGLDAAFAKKPILTLVHIVPGLILVTLVPFQFSRSFRNAHLRAHRWMGRTIMILGLVIGISAVLLLLSPVGGLLEVSAILVFDALFLLCLTKAFLHIRRGEIALHREWIIRAMSVALGVATVRPIMGMFFATRRMTRLTAHDFFGMAFWIGLSLTYLAGEMWIRSSRGIAALPFPRELASAEKDRI